jgi:hypothetical protein
LLTPQPGNRQPRSRWWSARRKAGGIVRVRAPTSSRRPASSWRITTRLASHARRWDVSAPDGPVRHAGSLVQGLARGCEGLHEQRANFRLEPPPEDHHAVLVLVHVERSARMPQGGLPGLGPPVYTPPTADDPLDVGGRPCARHPQEPGFRLRSGHAGEGTHLGVRHLSAGKGLGEERQRLESPRDPDPFTRRTQIEPHPPGEPRGAGAEARVPTASGIELPDHGEKPRGGGVEVRGQLGDLVA